ncbi:uncharacterized protein KY384_002847 [Bacidia gigantensis]|uniref:uncharacterized protein n=1 Tax=Bacidia gigantensis TaxID=2732470 RepID=UPI001D04A92C|nr:uncharacterized protein KY384_002847 [Bacidia gigantensis]KAG8532362.1 hypothetical protein KY384_002847 [Bacidia gigantensis]
MSGILKSDDCKCHLLSLRAEIRSQIWGYVLGDGFIYVKELPNDAKDFCKALPPKSKKAWDRVMKTQRFGVSYHEEVEPTKFTNFRGQVTSTSLTKVYEYCCVETKHLGKLRLALLLCSSQTHQECLPVLWKAKTFVVSLKKTGDILRLLPRALSKTQCHSLRKMKLNFVFPDVTCRPKKLRLALASTKAFTGVKDLTISLVCRTYRGEGEPAAIDEALLTLKCMNFMNPERLSINLKVWRLNLLSSGTLVYYEGPQTFDDKVEVIRQALINRQNSFHRRRNETDILLKDAEPHLPALLTYLRTQR